MPLAMPTPTDCYCFIGSDQTRVWSSKRAAYVELDDATYQVYATRYVTRTYPTELSLSEYLDNYGIVGPVGTPAQVDREAYRRISTGFVWNGHPIQMRDEAMGGVRKNDQINLAAQAQIADRAIGAGAQPGDFNWCADPEMQPFVWRDANNVTFPLDAQSMIEMAEASARWKRLNTWAGSALKSMSPIPRNFAESGVWPTLAALSV